MRGRNARKLHQVVGRIEQRGRPDELVNRNVGGV